MRFAVLVDRKSFSAAGFPDNHLEGPATIFRHSVFVGVFKGGYHHRELRCCSDVPNGLLQVHPDTIGDDMEIFVRYGDYLSFGGFVFKNPVQNVTQIRRIYSAMFCKHRLRHRILLNIFERSARDQLFYAFIHDF